MSIHSTSPVCELARARRQREHGVAGHAEGALARSTAASPGTRGRRCSTSRRARRSRAGTRRRGRWRARRAGRLRARVRIARSLIACAWRMHSSSSSVFVSLAGARAALPSTTSRSPSAFQSGNGASSSASRPPGSSATSSAAPLGGLDLDRGVQVIVGELGRRALGELGVEVRRTGRRASRRRRRATRRPAGGRTAGTRAPGRVRDVRLVAQHERVDAGGGHRGPQLVDPVPPHAREVERAHRAGHAGNASQPPPATPVRSRGGAPRSGGTPRPR